MAQSILLTLMSDGRSVTASFDPSSTGMLYIGDRPAPTAATAMAVVESSAEGARLVPMRGYELATAAGERMDALALDAIEEGVYRIGSARTGSVSLLYARRSTVGARTYRKLGFSCDAAIRIGRAPECGFLYASALVSSDHALLELVGDDLFITDRGSSNGTFLNGRLLASGARTALSAGDVVQIVDLVMMAGRRQVVLNEPKGFSIGSVPGATFIGHDAFKAACPPASPTAGELELFYPAPRLTHSIHKRAFQIDDPPQMKKPDEEPALMQLGPSFIMGFASLFMAASAVSRIMNGGDLLSSLPTVAMSVGMVSGMLVWPVISKRYNKRRDAREELKRETRYTDYLNAFESRLADECETQAAVLRENRVPVSDLVERARELSTRLMNRSTVHDDFMDLRVGVGETDLEADFRWPVQRFTMEDDKLLDKVSALAKNPPRVRDVPLAFDPAEHFVAGVLGRRAGVWDFARGLVLQICALYSYQEVKIILIADPAEQAEWAFMRSLPHLFDATGERRFIATDPEGLMAVSMLLERELDQRREQRVEKVGDYSPYYVVLAADKALAERSDTLARLARLRSNRGFSLIYLGETLRDLPRDCAYVIDLDLDGLKTDLGESGTQRLGAHAITAESGSARMFDRDDVSGTMTPFEPDIMVDAPTARTFALDLVRARLDVTAQHGQIPNRLGFLEMFECGNVAQLNIAQRWADNDASRTLATPVGLDAQREYSILNLHEKAHGPHGLIAGTTGSGKSEFIITYVLSMCVNYAPDEVAFVLIDYKGGGLAGAFENERIHLPHLAGTITNLDGAAINRSLVSIKSELKRRQDLFNRARDITGEATVDIYKYLSYYRQGVLTEPLPHLFIVADEFAELKQQEPEFMDELISAARIGRSLGVHLILATQKPTGVVNDQIWSNSRFKVCLKVADAADSKEMIRRPDAAEITEPGRFYLLVGYNEYFAAGQSAYTGSGYAPTDVFEPRRDNAVELIDDTAAVIASLRTPSTAAKTGESELNAVLMQVQQTAKTLGKRAQTLWLNPLPARIGLDDLRGRCDFQADPEGLSALLGEVDDPGRQRQFPHAVDIAAAGNLMLYGAQGSGVDGLAATLLYSLSEDYGPDRLSYYVIDLGSGVFSPFAQMPQCGGVVLMGDTERFMNLFRLIDAEIARRRAALAAAGMGLAEYNRQADAPFGRIVVLINNLAAFYDLFQPLEDRLNALTRDAPRYGIHFLVTASSSGVPRMRLKANFSSSVVCALNDESDYVTIFGRKPGVVAPKQDKRGLIAVGKEVFEFQGASIAPEGGSDAQAVAEAARRLAQRDPRRARPIPVLPRLVHAGDMGEAALEPGLVPVGFSKEAVAPVSFSFERCPAMLVLGNDVEDIARYLRGVSDALSSLPQGAYPYRIIDTEGILGETGDPNVVQGIDRAALALTEVMSMREPVSLLAFTSIVQTVKRLPDAVSAQLKDYLAQERFSGVTGLLAASELFRTRSIYDDWYKVVSAYGNGVWVGGGFGDQAVFKFARALPEYRQPAARSDGFFCMRGDVVPVRLIESTNEPEEE